MAYQKQIEGENVPNDQKLFSIYEQHTDIIVKGSRDVLFGHKVNLATGKSNLIIDCHIPKGNPFDKTLFAPTLDRVIENYGIIPPAGADLQSVPLQLTTKTTFASQQYSRKEP